MFWALAATGCTRTFNASVTQPNPLAQPLETLRESASVTIVTGDMELSVPTAVAQPGATLGDGRYPLMNTARFTVVSRDRLRFHVQIEHKWEDWVDLGSWHASLTDDQGHSYKPEEVDPSSAHHIVQMWDIDQRSTVTDRFGDVVWVNNDGYKRRQPLASLSVFRGKGDFVFHHRDIFNPAIKRLTLHLERSGTAFEFTWRFADDPLPNQVAYQSKRIR
jgi:hypothetical protein